MNKRNFTIFLIFILFFLVSSVYAQKSKGQLFQSALNYFNEEEFNKALPLFLEYDSLYKKDFKINYYIAACYSNTPYQKNRATPYLEYVGENDKNNLPAIINKDFAKLYQLEYKFDKAIKLYNRYLSIANKETSINHTNRDFVIQNIKNCKYAKKEIAINSNSKTKIKAYFSKNKDSNRFPYVSTDGELLFFTKTIRKKEGIVIVDSISKIFFSLNQDSLWGEPQELKITFPDSAQNSSLVGISPQGSELFFRIDFSKKNSDLYVCKFANDSCWELKAFNKKINTKFRESMCSITADGKDFYYSSNKPGGYGGLDIYKISRKFDGSWTEPQNLGIEINTSFDEDGPFIHPDKQTLYYSSKGKLAYGGYDFYKSKIQSTDNSWSLPQNLGYPINTTYDDIGIYFTADANYAYFSSNNKNKNQKFDIYRASFSKTIPLTLVKGIITDENNNPIKAKIKVIEHNTKEQIKYIYSPNPKTGKYLMIFPPNKNYDLIIIADGYIPHVINVHIPNQTYFYNLYQKIKLTKIKLNEFNKKRIGEKISVSNTFYDIYNIEQADSSLYTKIFHKYKKPDYSNLLNIINELIEKTDSIGISELDAKTIYKEDITRPKKNYSKLLDLVGSAIETTDSSTLNLLDINTQYNENIEKSYFYNNENKNLVDYIIDIDTIKTHPILSTKDINQQLIQEKDIDFQNININNKKYILEFSILFDNNISTLKPNKKLLETAKLIANSSDVGVEILGYADAKGNIGENIKLSKLRAKSAQKILLNNYVNKNKITIKWYGAKNATAKDNPNDRKIEIKVYQIKDITNP